MTSRVEPITAIYKVYLAYEAHYHKCLGDRGKRAIAPSIHLFYQRYPA